MSSSIFPVEDLVTRSSKWVDTHEFSKHRKAEVIATMPMYKCVGKISSLPSPVVKTSDMEIYEKLLRCQGQEK